MIGGSGTGRRDACPTLRIRLPLLGVCMIRWAQGIIGIQANWHCRSLLPLLGERAGVRADVIRICVGISFAPLIRLGAVNLSNFVPTLPRSLGQEFYPG